MKNLLDPNEYNSQSFYEYYYKHEIDCLINNSFSVEARILLADHLLSILSSLNIKGHVLLQYSEVLQ